MFFRSANSIEGRVFFEKFPVADLNQIAVSYCIGKFFSAQKKRLDKSNPTVQNSLPYVA
jgi:hypothetical protein